MTSLVDRARAFVTLAMILILFHDLDELRSHESGAGANAVMTAVIGALLVGFAHRLPRIVRGVLLLLLGLNAAVQGSIGHLAHIAAGSPRGADWTGILFVLGGLLLGLTGAASLTVRPASRA